MGGTPQSSFFLEHFRTWVRAGVYCAVVFESVSVAVRLASLSITRGRTEMWLLTPGGVFSSSRDVARTSPRVPGGVEHGAVPSLVRLRFNPWISSKHSQGKYFGKLRGTSSCKSQDRSVLLVFFR